jgi:PAS domain-containing protein
LVALIFVVLGLSAVTLWATLQWQKSDSGLREHYQRSLLLQEVRAGTFRAFKELPDAISKRDPNARVEFEALLSEAEKDFRAWTDWLTRSRSKSRSRTWGAHIPGWFSTGNVFSTWSRPEIFRRRPGFWRIRSKGWISNCSRTWARALALLGYYFMSGLFRPLGEVEKALGALGRGDLQRRIPEAGVLNPSSAGAKVVVRMLVLAFNRTVDVLGRTTVSKIYLDRIIESMVDALIVASPDGKIRTANPAAGKLFGATQTEL